MLYCLITWRLHVGHLVSTNTQNPKFEYGHNLFMISSCESHCFTLKLFQECPMDGEHAPDHAAVACFAIQLRFSKPFRLQAF